MGKVINVEFPKAAVGPRAVFCGCGESERFVLLESQEVYCSGCGYIISNLQWEQIDDQGSGEG